MLSCFERDARSVFSPFAHSTVPAFAFSKWRIKARGPYLSWGAGPNACALISSNWSASEGGRGGALDQSNNCSVGASATEFDGSKTREIATGK